MPTWAKWASVLVAVAVIAGSLGFYFWWHEEHTSQPDLVIQDMAWSPTNPSVGETVSFNVTMKNEGGGNSGSSKVYFFVDDSYKDSEQADPIVHGGITTLIFTWVAEAGSHKIRAVADYENSIAERDEANNEKEVTVTIATVENMPTITSISLNQGALEQTFYVTITGTNLTGATIVSFGAGVTVNSYSVNSATQMTAHISIAGDAPPGARDVSVTGPVGTGTLPDGFRVTVPLVNIAPLYGIASADATWSDDLAGNAIDGDYASYWSAGSHASPSNPHWLEVDLQQNRQVREIAVNLFQWAAGGPYLGYTNVYNLYVSSDGSSWTLLGSGTIGESTDPEVNSHRHILSDQVPAIRYIRYEVVGGTHWAGLVEMEVLVDSGTEHPPVPTVTSVNPDHGGQGQTLTITINGTNFTGATAVSFEQDVTVNSFTVDSATQITANISISAAATTVARTIVVNGAYLQSGFMVILTGQ